MDSIVPRALALVVIAGALVMSGCSIASGDAAETSPRPTETAVPTPDEGDEYADAFAERDAFIAAQQLPLDGSLLVATTDAQKEFIAEQRAYIEQQGGTWSPELESTALALAADACETAILNQHEVELMTLETHVATSPLFAQLIADDLAEDERRAAERNVASVMVFGTGYLCPDDAEQWEAAFTAAYPG
ncbi:hypothetical protein BJY17_000539 [Agromyces hippuratus]|uniref:DUF732 domain-containing protein n=1 Tax=Agromyces hippuratus TaxID=286438 RepID=A0A852WNS9_9MICO|nr:hypothetical protein [Agromyces hippuratus]NYG19792.1 hypothetical protein [Agromyces hippuratus]